MVSNKAAGLLLGCSILAVLNLAGCGESRMESRQRRLDTFRNALPEEVCLAFDSIQSPGDCSSVGEMLTEARASDPAVDAAVDSIMHAELVDGFTDAELVSFFHVHFAQAISTGSVPDP